MIPVFFCHICDEKDNCRFAIKLAERLQKDIKGIEPFIACQNSEWHTAKDLNTELDQCYFFISIISSEFSKKNNCLLELKRARDRKKQNDKYPIIFPIKYCCDCKTMTDLKFNINQSDETGERWIDFSNKDEFNVKYEEFYKRLYSCILDNNLVTNEDFSKDRKILDVILQENKPTSSYIKIAIDYCRKGEEYSHYFFKNLSNSYWLIHLYASGFFNNNPSPIESEKDTGYYSIPFWPVLTYLEKISLNVQDKLALTIIDIIRKVTKPFAPAVKQDNYRTWWSFVKIMANLPSDVVKLEDIDLVADWLDSKFYNSMIVSEIGNTLLPKFLSVEDEHLYKAERLIEIVINSIKEKSNDGVTYRLKEIFKHNATLLGEKCGENVSHIVRKKIEELISEKDDAYCYIWRPAIEDHKQNIGKYEIKYILVFALRDILLAYASKNDASRILCDYFKSQKFIIKRIVLYVLNKLFDKYKSLSERIIKEHIDSILFESNYQYEWYMFLKEQFTKFSPELQSEVIDKISKLKGDWKEEVDKELLNKILRSRLFYAISSSGYNLSEDIKNAYLKDYKEAHPEFLSYRGPIEWGMESVFSATDLLAQGTIENIIDFLNKYEGKNRWGELAISEAGQSLKDAIKSKQEFFEGSLSVFKECKWEYWCYIFQAFEELWGDKKYINWYKILAFSSIIVNEKSLWEKDEDNGKKRSFHNPNKDWAVSAIADLIKKGVQNDEWSMPDDCLNDAEDIIRIMMDKQKSTSKGEKENGIDALNEVINTTKGHVIECFIQYALRRYRIYEKLPDKGAKEKEMFWNKIKPVFDREIERTKEGNFEFSCLAGTYLPNLYYLNKDWVERNINNIFSKEEKHWYYAMQGYTYVNTIYSVIYKLLKDNGHFKRAIDEKFDNSQIKRRLIESITLSYIGEKESLEGEDSLFKYLLDKSNLEDIEHIIGFLWAHRDSDLSEKQKQRILEFWKCYYNRIKGHEEENKNVLSALNLLTVFLDEIKGEQKKWLIQSAPYVEERYHSSFFLEYLDKLADVNIEEVGEIFLKMLDRTVPSYKEENIKSIVKKIYKAKLNNIANPIYDKYARAGFDFLTEIYNNNNPNDKI